MDIEEMVDRIYAITMGEQIMVKTREEQIKRYIELYEELKQEA